MTQFFIFKYYHVGLNKLFCKTTDNKEVFNRSWYLFNGAIHCNVLKYWYHLPFLAHDIVR